MSPDVSKENIAVFSHTWQIIANPTAMSSTGHKHWNTIADILNKLKLDYRFYLSNDITTSDILIRELCKEGHRHFIAIGGDGTINSVINGLFLSGVNTSEIYLGIIPLGTGNDWCRTHNYPRSYVDTMNIFLRGQFLRHDIGIIDCIQNGNIIQSRHFINIAGFGFDARVVHKIATYDSHTSYVYIHNVLKVLFTHKAQPVHIQTDNTDIERNIFSIAVGICRYNGNGMLQVPMANPTDGIFNVMTLNKISPLKIIRNIKKLYSGNIEHIPEVQYITASHLHLSSPVPLAGEIEGEVIPLCHEYDIRILPQAINILTGL